MCRFSLALPTHFKATVPSLWITRVRDTGNWNTLASGSFVSFTSGTRRPVVLAPRTTFLSRTILQLRSWRLHPICQIRPQRRSRCGTSNRLRWTWSCKTAMGILCAPSCRFSRAHNPIKLPQGRAAQTQRVRLQSRGWRAEHTTTCMSPAPRWLRSKDWTGMNGKGRRYPWIRRERSMFSSTSPS